MAGLVPAIHVFLKCGNEDVDARHKAGHDELDVLVQRKMNHPMFLGVRQRRDDIICCFTTIRPYIRRSIRRMVSRSNNG
jgi:hypothetical protein